MLRSMFAGLSGLVNHQTGLDVIGNNIANVNTIGFKASRVTFQDLLSQTLTGASSPAAGGVGGTNGKQVGLGSKLGTIDTEMTQGNLQSTGNFTDLAIEGNGFFVLSDGNLENMRYSRAGNFNFDSDGNLVSPAGLHVMGWLADEDGNVSASSALTSINIPSGITIPAEPTDTITYGYNLNALAYVEGQAELQAGNSCNVQSVAGNWTGDVTEGAVTTSYDKIGTHTINITPQKAQGLKSTLPIPSRFVTVQSLIDSETLRVGGGGAINGANADGTYSLFIDVDGVQKEVRVETTDSIESILEKINTQVAGVTATFSNGNICVTRNIAGDSRTVGVYDNVVANATAVYGIADLLFSNDPTNADFTANSTQDAQISWTFTPSDGSSTSFSNKTTALSFAPGDLQIEGFLGTIITAGDEGFKEGSAVINTLSPQTHATSTRVYDSLGTARNVTITFERISDLTWEFEASGDGVAGSGEIQFTQDGQFQASTDASVILGPQAGSEQRTVQLDFRNVTQYSGDSSLVSLQQDGYGQGTLDSYTIDQAGVIVGRFSNGLNRNLAMIATAAFTNPQGLQKMADSTFAETNNSGTPQIGSPSVGGRGKISTGTLEMSNVDIAKEFSNMIIYQRGFQANAKMITTGDEILNTLVNIKR